MLSAYPEGPSLAFLPVAMLVGLPGAGLFRFSSGADKRERGPSGPAGKEVGTSMYPSLDEVRRIARQTGCAHVPVCEELLSDRYTPVEVLRTLRSASHHCFLLESAAQAQGDLPRWGRWSFLGCNPSMEVVCQDGKLRVREGQEGGPTREEVREVAHPGEFLRELIATRRTAKVDGMPPFTGGLVGYFSFEYLRYAEPTLACEGLPGDFRDMDLMLFDQVIAFDNDRQRLLVIAGAYADDLEASYARAQERIEGLIALIEGGTQAYFPRLRLEGQLRPRFDEGQFCAMVERAKRYIREGDIFQVVLSNPLSAPAQGSLLDVYRVLRTTNPSPYMVYFTSDDVEIAGASPETLARLDEGVLRTFPLAGTRPRGATEEADAALEAELLADEKELAEHNMLVDLGRNDLGRVCELGSVRVDEYLQVRRFSRVMHLGSIVEGCIAQGKDAVDAVDAILPAGTLSGAPKLRACQIIAELEGSRRGVYGGAIGYLDFSGNMDTCIGIRLAYKKDGRICVQSGAGIVADSVAANEFAECCNKAAAVVDAIDKAQGGVR